MEQIYKDIKSLLARILWLTGAFACFTTYIAAQETINRVQTEEDSLSRHISREMSAEFSCHFTYAQRDGAISFELESNTAELEKLDVFIRRALSHPTLFISRILLTGYNPIEGAYAHNELMARLRVEQFDLYLRKYHPKLNLYPHDLAWVAEDWDDLSKRIKASPLSEREEILTIIRKVPVYDTREELLMKLNGGKSWLFMERELFPASRRVELKIEFTDKPHNTNLLTTDKPTSASPHAALAHNPMASPQPSPKESELGHAASDSLFLEEGRGEAIEEGRSEAVPAVRTARFALKTNLLLWAGVQSDLSITTPVVNAALEYYITSHWSVEVGAKYSYWRYNSLKEFQGISGYRLESRYHFFPNDRFGIYLGLYGRFGDYDLQTVRSSQFTINGSQLTVNGSQLTIYSSPFTVDNAAQPNYQYSIINFQFNNTLNYTGDYWDAGLSAGISIRLVGNLGLEAGARAGYIHSDALKYTRDNYDNWFDSRWKYRKVRITDLDLNLIYKF
jgi:hypothetical protein